MFWPIIQDVYYPEHKIRRIRIILIIVGGILALSLLAIALVYIVRGLQDEGEHKVGSGIRLEDVLYGGWVSRTFNGSWATNGNIIYKQGKVSYIETLFYIIHFMQSYPISNCLYDAYFLEHY